jgi:superfamily I DNA/RNA helicase
MGLRWPALQEAGIATVRIDASDEHKAGPGVRLCTMHRAKGLEFRHVLVAGVGDERFPRPADEPDEDRWRRRGTTRVSGACYSWRRRGRARR